MDAFVARLTRTIGGERVHAFAQRANIGDTSLRKYLNGSLPGIDKAAQIADAAGVSLDWLITGRGEMRPADGGQSAQPRPVEPGFVMVPRYEVQAAAGIGALGESEHVVDYMAFQERWVREELRVDPAALALISAVGDSMEPTIRPGDLLLVDTSIDRVQDDAIYVIALHGDLHVKRLQHIYDGSVRISSDNRDRYADQVLPPSVATDLLVRGRVRWIARIV